MQELRALREEFDKFKSQADKQLEDHDLWLEDYHQRAEEQAEDIHQLAQCVEDWRSVHNIRSDVQNND